MYYDPDIDLSTAPSGALHVVAWTETWNEMALVWHTHEGNAGWEPWERVGSFAETAALRMRWTTSGELHMTRFSPSGHDSHLLKWSPPWETVAHGAFNADWLSLFSGPNPIQQIELPDGRRRLYVVGRYSAPNGAARLLMAEEKVAGTWTWSNWQEQATPPQTLHRLVFVKRMQKDSVMAYCAGADGYLLTWDGKRWQDYKSVKTQVAGAYIVDRGREESYFALGTPGVASETILAKAAGPVPIGKPIPTGGLRFLPEYLSGHYPSDGRIYLFVALNEGGVSVIAEKSPGSAFTSEGWAAPMPLIKTDLPIVALRVSWWGGGALACLAAFRTGAGSIKLGLAKQAGPGSTTWRAGWLPDLP